MPMTAANSPKSVAVILDDEQFVRAAYLTSPGRHLPEGMASHVGHLRSGRDERELFNNLVLSEEGRAVALDVSGLSALLDSFGARNNRWARSSSSDLRPTHCAPYKRNFERLRTASTDLKPISQSCERGAVRSSRIGTERFEFNLERSKIFIPTYRRLRERSLTVGLGREHNPPPRRHGPTTLG